MTNTLPPLSLDDIRVAGPDRDNAEAFDPAETWCLACDKIAEGYTADTVAGLLLDMPLTETSMLWQWWDDECRSVQEDGTGRDAQCRDLRLAVAIAAEDARTWRLPLIDPYTVLELLAQRDRAIELLRTCAGFLADVPGEHDAIDGAHKLLRDVTGTGLWAAGEGTR